MRQGHFALMFCIIFAVCYLFLWREQKQYDYVLEEKQRIEKSLLEAVENAAKELTAVLNDSLDKKRRVIEAAFLDALYVDLGIFDDKEEQEKFKMYLPLLIFVEEDGVLFFHMQEKVKDGVAEFHHVWTEKYYFSFTGEDSEAKRKLLISELLEERASVLISQHNYIAEQHGIEYTFYVPGFLQNTSESLEFPMLFVVFQGWPLNAAGDIVYENCIDAGAYLQEVEYYVVEIPQNINQTICFYHKDNCVKLSAEEGKRLKERVTELEAIKEYGAIPCESCIY